MAFPHCDLQTLLSPFINAQGSHRAARWTSGSSMFRLSVLCRVVVLIDCFLPSSPSQATEPLLAQPTIHTAIYQRAFHHTGCWQCKCEAEEGRGPLSPSKSTHSSAFLNPATFALLNLGEYEKHSLLMGGGGGTRQLLAFFNSCQVLCNSKSMSGKPPLAAQQWPRPSKPGDQCLNPFQSASELAYFKKMIESGSRKQLPLK